MKKLITKSKIFNIYEEEIELKGRKRIVESISLFNDVKASVMVAPFTATNEFILTEEYCPGMDKKTFIFPGGVIDDGETNEMAAKRELEEEIKLSPQKIEYLTTIDIFPKYMLGSTHFFVAREFEKCENNKEEFAQTQIIKKSITQLKQMIKTGEIQDCRTLALALLAIAHLEK